ncbi:uridine nucleosidase 1-like [Homarus americanus]|uniref:Uridine nucleosidase 1-like n=1 Tax=Homarus americanus TaxID=6706 RepID=A0A8J5MKV2_HOMAM|nr:uridine nucleosidase 1-like [Homarus americanus]
MSVPKVIIDTDAGIDDALAIFMALAAHKRGEIEVIAVTTVHGNTGVHHVNNNIPVYSGAAKSLVHPWTHSGEMFHGTDGFGDAHLPAIPPASSLLKPQHAVWTLLELVNKYPNEIVLTALGPLTNVALAIRLEPAFTSRLAAIYAMGGNTRGCGDGEGRLVSTSKSCFATVELNGSLTRGQMAIDHRDLMNRTSNLIIMTSIDEQLYLRYLKMAFGGEF